MAHTGQSLRPWHQLLRALDSKVNDSFVANFCWRLPGNSQACPFPRLQSSKNTVSSYTWLKISHPISQGMGVQNYSRSYAGSLLGGADSG